MSDMIDFETDPSQYRHWRVEYDGDVAQLFMDVDENGGLFDGYDLKLNSYDLGVDIELADIVQRMRFEHPEIRVVVLKSGKDKVFCAGANIRMLAGAAHAHKVNFCKFTNETRNAIENAEFESGQKYVAAIKGACAGGGFELALACNHIILVDDGASTVALPEVPLLAVLPGTGGLTRLTDKRQVRRDLCDVFCAMEEGVRGARALDWRLVDEIVSNSKFNDVVDERAAKFASELGKPSHVGIALTPLQKTIAEEGSVHYSTLTIEVDRIGGTATLMINGPDTAPPANIDDFVKAGSDSYMLRLARELDDAILHLRLNEREAGLLIFRSQGNPATLLEHEEQLHKNSGHWLANEVLLYWKRILKRVDVTSRSMAALVEHGSCFAGLLAELLFSVDRTYMMDG